MKRLCISFQRFAIILYKELRIIGRGAKMKHIRISRKVLLILLAVFFMSVGSLGTVALANYTNIVVEASVVNVRLGPGLSYDMMTQVQGGTVVNVLAEKNEWYKIRLDDGRIGWIASWLVNNTEVTASQNLIATITASNVNVRAENNEEAEIVGTAVQGETFQLLYEESGWSQIHYEGRIAWVLSDLLEISPGTTTPPEAETSVTEEGITESASSSEQSIIISNDAVNIRSGPSLDSEVLLTAQSLETFPYVGTEGDFYQILLPDNQTGYVANWLAELQEANEEIELPKITTLLSEATIVIDAGHGGTDPGAIGSYLYEKEATMETSERVAERLRAEGANVILTRTGDESISLEERVYLSNSYQADLFISIHYDSTPEGVFRTGTTTYYYSDSDMHLAELVNEKLTNNLPLPNNGTAFGNYLVLRENAQPALLLELGYMNNDSDVSTFDSEYYQGLVADSIYQALAEYFQ